jgi:hypothetical protein
MRVTVKMCNQETSFTHEASDSNLNYGQIMQCIVKYDTGVY